MEPAKSQPKQSLEKGQFYFISIDGLIEIVIFNWKVCHMLVEGNEMIPIKKESWHKLGIEIYTKSDLQWGYK